jgi:hypothetical protein
MPPERSWKRRCPGLRPTLHSTTPTASRSYELDNRSRPWCDLEIAAREGSKIPRNVLAYAVALHSAGQTDEAIEHLRRGLEHNPFDRDLISTIVQYYRKIGDLAESERFAARLLSPAGLSPEANGN